MKAEKKEAAAPCSPEQFALLLTGPAAGVIAIAAAVRSIRNWQRKQVPEEKPRPLIVATILAMLVAALAWTAGWIAYRIWFGRTY